MPASSCGFTSQGFVAPFTQRVCVCVLLPPFSETESCVPGMVRALRGVPSGIHFIHEPWPWSRFSTVFQYATPIVALAVGAAHAATTTSAATQCTIRLPNGRYENPGRLARMTTLRVEWLIWRQ